MVREPNRAGANMHASFSFLAALLTLLGGGTNDLLDYIPSDVFWKAKHAVVTPEAMIAELKDQQGEDIAQLIKDLGANEFQQREDAGANSAARAGGYSAT